MAVTAIAGAAVAGGMQCYFSAESLQNTHEWLSDTGLASCKVPYHMVDGCRLDKPCSVLHQRVCLGIGIVPLYFVDVCSNIGRGVFLYHNSLNTWPVLDQLASLFREWKEGKKDSPFLKHPCTKSETASANVVSTYAATVIEL